MTAIGDKAASHCDDRRNIDPRGKKKIAPRIGQFEQIAWLRDRDLRAYWCQLQHVRPGFGHAGTYAHGPDRSVMAIPFVITSPVFLGCDIPCDGPWLARGINKRNGSRVILRNPDDVDLSSG